MKTAKLILLCLSGMFAMQSATAQSRSEKKAQTERNVREAINADHYKINVEHYMEDKEPQRDTDYYYVRVRQRDGQWAWSSPIWAVFVTDSSETDEENAAIIAHISRMVYDEVK